MFQFNIYAVATNHGFGHATRLAYTLSALKKKYPNAKLVINSTIPRTIFDSILRCDFEYIAKPLDVGLVQFDSIHIDYKKTLERLNEIYLNEKNLISENLTLLKKHKINLLIGDIPPLLCDIAKRAELPLIQMGNFSWNFIYQAYVNEFKEFKVFVDRTEESYDSCPVLFRYPFHESMKTFPRIKDIGLIPGLPSLTKLELYKKLGISHELHKPIRLFVFGGLGIDNLPFEKLKKIPVPEINSYHYISYQKIEGDIPFLQIVNDLTIRPLDILPFCERIITKPGHGILTDAYSTKVPVVCVDRQLFPEIKILLENVKNYFYHITVDDNQLKQSNWDFVYAPFNPPKLLDKTVDCAGEVPLLSMMEKRSFTI